MFRRNISPVAQIRKNAMRAVGTLDRVSLNREFFVAQGLLSSVALGSSTHSLCSLAETPGQVEIILATSNPQPTLKGLYNK